uniref:sphingosine-1-phosphate lyase 1 n=1 Tax=Ciona intestinalis TaxID=7719 RepID=UPI000180C1A9|nr:sphingosine-1-phosphate lyase 1 [Ciona intestinalis]|eukprot:XP_002127038.1 sphingosine-1-phosphate lyase 1 [Ciona intestinalis]
MTEVLNQILNKTVDSYNLATKWVNSSCSNLLPHEIIIITVITIFFTFNLYNFIFENDKSFFERVKVGFFYHAKRLPIIRSIVKQQMESVLNEVSAEKLFPLKSGMHYLNKLPIRGKTHLQIDRVVEEYLSLDDVDWKNGNVSGTVYGGDAGLTDVITKVYKKFAWSNPLHPEVFPGLRKMEAEIVRISCELFNGNPQTSCGSVTIGGTESILLACKTYRDWAYGKGIQKPEIVCPVSVHAAFEKAAHYFRMKLVHVPVDSVTRKVNVSAMKNAISRNTCMLVGSTPPFPHGVLDPITEIAALGMKYNIPVHVDACLGGFLLPFMSDAGFPVPPFDFSVPGVTSISADTHKYGYSPKGSSVVLYSDKKWIHYQYFVSPDWQGGIYATPMFAGSRSGAIIAACWATMMYFGREGYVNRTKKIITTARYIEQGLRKIEYIYVLGKPEMSVVALGSLDFDVFRLSTELVKRGWNLNNLQFPASIHICCTMPHTHPGVADRLLQDIRESVDIIMSDPKAKATGAGAIYGMAQSIPDRSIVTEISHGFIDALYDTGSKSVANGNGYAK